MRKLIFERKLVVEGLRNGDVFISMPQVNENLNSFRESFSNLKVFFRREVRERPYFLKEITNKLI